MSALDRFRWWHGIRQHRMRCDIDPHRMVTVCDCGHTWVDIGQGGSAYVKRNGGH